MGRREDAPNAGDRARRAPPDDPPRALPAEDEVDAPSGLPEDAEEDRPLGTSDAAPEGEGEPRRGADAQPGIPRGEPDSTG